MRVEKPIRVAALVDLPRSPEAGGHVKCWERLAEAAADAELPLDLTVYFSGRHRTEVLGPGARLAHLPPLLSTAQLKFLPYVPDHTDLAPYHPRLARELADYDLIHTTDAFFAFANRRERQPAAGHPARHFDPHRHAVLHAHLHPPDHRGASRRQLAGPQADRRLAGARAAGPAHGPAPDAAHSPLRLRRRNPPRGP